MSNRVLKGVDARPTLVLFQSFFERRPQNLSPLIFILFLFAVLTPIEVAVAAERASLKMYWSNPISGKYVPSWKALVIEDIVSTTTGSMALFAREGRSGVFLTEPNETGPGPATQLKSKAVVLGIAEGAANTFWLGGGINHRSYLPGWDMSDAYLGKFDNKGNIIAEYTFSSFRFRMAQAVLPLPTGNVVIAGFNGGENLLSMISDQGKVLWERSFGSDKGVALATIRDRIFATSFEGIILNDKEDYREDVSVRSFDQAGNVLERQVIRTGLNESRGAHYGRLAIESAGDAIYVLSGWGDPSKAKPIEVAKLTADGSLIWRKVLPHSISQRKNHGWDYCDQGQTVLADGDLLVACSIKDQILIFRLGAKLGELSEMSVPLPECHEGRPAALFLSQRHNGAIWLFGSRPGNMVAESCTWLGELSLR